MSTLDITHMIKCTWLSPSLAGRAWNKASLGASDCVKTEQG